MENEKGKPINRSFLGASMNNISARKETMARKVLKWPGTRQIVHDGLPPAERSWFLWDP
jgi:hypothetical protein